MGAGKVIKQLLLSWGAKKKKKTRGLLRYSNNNKAPQRDDDDVRPPAEGRIWVRVGRDDDDDDEASLQKVAVEARFLGHPLFGDLLRLSGDEFGHNYDGALRLACDAALFLRLVELLRSGDPAVHYMQLSDLLTN